jgi:hypothetical protein
VRAIDNWLGHRGQYVVEPVIWSRSGRGLESELARIWWWLLDLERIAPHDDCFAPGGHSNLATRVVSRLGSELRVELGLQAVFEHTTLAAQAHRLMEGLDRPAAAR